MPAEFSLERFDSTVQKAFFLLGPTTFDGHGHSPFKFIPAIEGDVRGRKFFNIRVYMNTSKGPYVTWNLPRS